jgi:thiol-disulfide isomerase/thioredoxin
MDKINKYLPWTIRIIIFALFMLSGISKMFPIWTFEKQIVDLGLASWCVASYLARLIIALEIAIAVAILQPHYLKTFVIPVTIALLVAFNIHLSIEMVKHGAMNGNCGCFGQLLPMTPLEAFIKNIVTIGLLIYLYLKVNNKPKGQNKFVYMLLIYAVSAFLMFAAFPFCPCKAEVPQDDTALITDTTSANSLILPESSPIDTAQSKVEKKDTIAKAPEEKSPKKVKSKYAQFTTFGNKTVNLDEGKKVLCFFAPGCDHCQNAAKEICKLKQKGGFPEVYVLFLDEEVDKIPTFFKIANCTFPYKILDIPTFFKNMGDDQTPAVHYLWNGNIMKSYSGTGDNEFKATGLVKVIEAKYK